MSKMGLDRAGRQVGRQVGNVLVLKESGEGGMRKLRCPMTQQVATPARRADGKKVYRTKNGVEYTTRRF
jgi:hypothetical protein